MLRVIGTLADRICAVCGALVFSQLPLFMQDYQQQLVGRISELRIQIQAMQQIAGDRTLDTYIQKFVSHNDSDIAQHGELLMGVMKRYESLQHAYTSLMQNGPLTKPIAFVSNLHQDVALSTWSHFEFGIPLSVEGGIYALIGIVVTMGVIRAISYPFRRKSGSKASAG